MSKITLSHHTQCFHKCVISKDRLSSSLHLNQQLQSLLHHHLISPNIKI